MKISGEHEETFRSAVFSGLNEIYGYNDIMSTASTRITSYGVSYYTDANDKNTADYEYEYEYDSKGNITKISKDNVEIERYTYDNASQLIRNDSVANDKSYTYTYDDGGNLVSKSEYAYATGTLGTATKTVGYGYDTTWADKLTSYDGKAITYDAIGNPLNYGDWEYTWTAGRQMATARNSDKLIEYTYNADGLRTSQNITYYDNNNCKTGESEFKYVWDGDRMESLELWDEGTTNADYSLRFIYDSSGEVKGFVFNDSDVCLYQKNLQGDITSIINEDGDLLISYNYDAWGNVTYSDNGCLAGGVSAEVLWILNPFTYRGYCYDRETGLFYVGSRYYDPEIGRFINADDPEILQLAAMTGDVLGANLFAYCANNPVNDSDPTGMFSLNSVLKFIKSLGWKALKVVSKIWSAFKQPGKINLKPFEIIIDAAILIFAPSVSFALKAVTYKAVNKQLVEIAFRNAGKSLINTLTKMGLKIGLNTLFSAAVNNLIFKHASRFLTVGGLVCLILDVIDGKIDYWFNYGRWA